MHPIFLVTGAIAKSLTVFPVSLNILSSPNINKESLNTFNPTIFVSTYIVPPPLALVKSLVSKGPIKLTCCSALGLPAKNI